MMLAAAWVAPMSAAAPQLLREGAVVFAGGHIIAVGPRRQLQREHPNVVVQDLGDAVILPGLVNAHVHLELSDAVPGPRPAGGFGEWLLAMVRRGGTRTAEQVAAAVEAGVAQCLRFGVTSVGDISRVCGVSRGILQQSLLNAVSYGEVAGMGKRRGQMEGLLDAAIRPPLPPGERWGEGRDEKRFTREIGHPTPGPHPNPLAGSRRIRSLLPEGEGTRGRFPTSLSDLSIGITPHAPYSIEPDGYQRCLAVARERDLPLATHLAESADEAVFLAQHTGPLRQLWALLDGWDEHVPRFAGGPIRYAQALGLLNYPTLLAHVNYCDDDEMEILARGKASVVYCPRTHAYFGHPPHRWREMLARGINVAVGTDSCASSPDLNLVDDLRLMHRIAPDVPAEVLWRMATINAATAIGQAERVGSLQVGKRADVVVFKAGGENPLAEILESGARPVEVWCDGVLH